MESRSYSLADPGLIQVLRDLRTMQRWEILRRTQASYTAARLAEESRSTLEVTQDSLDRLHDVGLVVKHRASAKTRQVAYRAAMQRLVVSYDKGSEIDRALIRSMEGGMREYSRSVIDACCSVRRENSREYIGVHGVTSVVLLPEDARAVRDAIRSAYALLVEAERRARAAAAQGAETKGYHLGLEMRELDEPELPMAEIFMVERSLFDEHRKLLCGAASMVLSPRELEVARALDAGKSRPTIARELGLSEHTVVTMSKRIYRKLGVHNRTELSARLNAA